MGYTVESTFQKINVVQGGVVQDPWYTNLLEKSTRSISWLYEILSTVGEEVSSHFSWSKKLSIIDCCLGLKSTVYESTENKMLMAPPTAWRPKPSEYY